MKTNHQRNFKDKKDSNSVYNRFTVFVNSAKLTLSDKSITAFVTCTDHVHGKKGIAKDVKGAKKYIRSRSRFYEKSALKKIVKSYISEMIK